MINFCLWRHLQKLCRHNLYFKMLLLEEDLGSHFCWDHQNYNQKKTQEKIKELEVMYQNAIYIFISWYNKICWFPVKKCWCQQNLGGVSRDWYIFWIFFRYSVTVPSFIIAGHVWQILGRRAFLPPHPWAGPKMSILNKVNAFLFASLSVLLNRWWSLYIATFNKLFIAFNLC